MNKAVYFLKYNIATGFGAGLSPVAPGTFGSLIGLALVWFFFPDDLLLRVLFGAVLIALSIYAGGWVAESEGVEDPQKVVIDEIAGQWVAFLLVPPLAMDSFKVLFLGLILFRIFDIWKPWPIRKAEALPGGVGITMDDVVAGVYAAVVLRILGIWLF